MLPIFRRWHTSKSISFWEVAVQQVPDKMVSNAPINRSDPAENTNSDRVKCGRATYSITDLKHNAASFRRVRNLKDLSGCRRNMGKEY
jgi:hypothetical protein